MQADDGIGKMIAERIGQDISMDLVKADAKGLELPTTLAKQSECLTRTASSALYQGREGTTFTFKKWW